MKRIELEQVLPGEIERRSFEIIQEELEAMGKTLDKDQELVIKRAIHTTADFTYADNLVFSPDAVKKGIAAIAQGAIIITDTKMGLAGINKKKLAEHGGRAVCFMADEDIAAAAKDKGITRAAASMEKAAALYGGGNRCSDTKEPDSPEVPDSPTGPDASRRPIIFALGNAPTALVRLCQLIEEGRITPALIIGAPVGFVNVVQSKELVTYLEQTPYIVVKGRKGGSNVAAAICNALLYQIPGSTPKT